MAPPTYTLSFLEPFDYCDPFTISWSLGAALQYPKANISLAMGASEGSAVTLTAIEYGGIHAMGLGPGGDHLVPSTVLNTTLPTGVLHFNKWYEIVIGIREDEFTALYNTSVSDSLHAIEMTQDNAPIGYLAYTQLGADGSTRKMVFDSGTIYLAGVTQSKTTTEDGKYVVELKFLCTGGYVAGGWLESFDYIEPPSMPLSFDEAFDS